MGEGELVVGFIFRFTGISVQGGGTHVQHSSRRLTLVSAWLLLVVISG